MAGMREMDGFGASKGGRYISSPAMAPVHLTVT